MGPAIKMAHFKNITSLSNLKDQYRKLALTNHPDRGGSTEIMQEINAEYFMLFPIWKNVSKDTSNETAKSTQREFYTAYGWKGDNYDINLRMTDITKIVRTFVKEKYPTYKFSITTPDVYSLHISLMEAPHNVFNSENLSEYETKSQYIQVNHYHVKNDNRITELCREILTDIIDFAQTYNFDDSDSMIDYFDTNFYLSTSVGKWDKPFKVVYKQARIKSKKKPMDVTN